MLTLHTLPLEPATLAALADCQTVRRVVTNKFFPNLGPDAAGIAEGVKRDSPIRYRICLPDDAHGTPGVVSLLVRSSLLEVSRGEDQKDEPLVDGSRVRVRMALGTNLCPTAEKEVPAWVRRTFEHYGMEASRVRVGRTLTAGLPGRAQFTHWDVSATIKIIDNAAAQQAFNEGIGGGRDYGFGLILVEPAP